MTDTYYSRVDYEYTGDSIFTIPFDYIKKDYISVYVDDEAITDYEFLNETQIQINIDLEEGQTVSILRTTPIDSLLVYFTNTSIMDKDTLNLAQNQMYHVIQEIYDNYNSLESVIQEYVTTELETFEASINNSLAELEASIDEKIETVSEAAELITEFKELIEANAETATEAAETATEALEQVLAFGLTYEVVGDITVLLTGGTTTAYTYTIIGTVAE